jgi:2,5-diamino-6-(ribosylamino)-4(3H)-pyrimidinone 5'-phosphate reductase
MKPVTTLFLLQSVDGKISTGDTDERDFDKDLSQIVGVKEGLHQYYDIEKQTDPVSLISGRVMAKIGANSNSLDDIKQIPITFVVVDNKPHLTAHGVKFLARKFAKVIIVTSNDDHPANSLKKQIANIGVMYFDDVIDFPALFAELRAKHGAERITVQSGGELNAVLMRAGLIDHVLIVVAPCLVGGRTTPTLVDGDSLHSIDDLAKIRPLKLKECKALDDSYVRLEYHVIN